MGRTIHEDVAQDELADVIASPDRAAELHRMVDRLQAEQVPAWMVSMIGQTREQPAYWPLHQVAAFTSVLTRLAFGKIARRRIPLGSTPGPDADRTGNAEHLSHLAAPFVAHLDMEQNGADSDGVLEWTEPINAWRSTGVQFHGAHVFHGAIQAPFQMRPTRCPLRSATPCRAVRSRTCSWKGPLPGGRTTRRRFTSWSTSNGSAHSWAPAPCPPTSRQ